MCQSKLGESAMSPKQFLDSYNALNSAPKQTKGIGRSKFLKTKKNLKQQKAQIGYKSCRTIKSSTNTTPSKDS